jgi:hypothetical protein
MPPARIKQLNFSYEVAERQVGNWEPPQLLLTLALTLSLFLSSEPESLIHRIAKGRINAESARRVAAVYIPGKRKYLEGFFGVLTIKPFLLGASVGPIILISYVQETFLPSGEPPQVQVFLASGSAPLGDTRKMRLDEG